MHINSSRFGCVEVQPDDILLFPAGLLGMEDCRHWVLLADANNEAVAWLQNIARPEVALAVVSPRRFVPGYVVRASAAALQLLQRSTSDQTFVLAAISINEQQLTINLKAPLLVNLDRRLGRQIITTDEQPLQYAIAELPRRLRKSA